MKSAVLLTSALVLALLLMASVAAAQTCQEGASCVVGGKKGSVSCAGGHAKCIPDPVLEDGVFCGDKACAVGKVCQDRQCVSTCKPGFMECGGTCRNLSADSANCGACGNACRSGTSCQASGGVGVCACTPPSISCGGACINPTNDPSNCGGCGKACGAPNTACRNSQCVPPEVPPSSGGAGSTGPLNLDLVWAKTDPNGLPFNPDWRGRLQPAFRVAQHAALDLTKACSACAPFVNDPDNFEDETCWRKCTSVPTTSDGGLFCTAGHINWVTATYAGKVVFDDYSARGFFSGIGEDDDYNFNLFPTDDAGNVTGAGFITRDNLHNEMSFFETIDQFQSTFWKHFGDLVDQVPGDDLSAPRALFAGRHAIMTGLLGLDVQHDGHAELHPIYSMAVRTTESPTQGPNPKLDCWAIFARNWGNEGFCSNHDHPLALNHITFHFPQPTGATAVTEISREIKSSNSTIAFVSEVGRVGDGAEITVFLGIPQERTFVNGQVCLRWAVPPGVQPPPVKAPPTSTARVEPDQEEHRLSGLNLLTPAQLAELRRSMPAKPSRDKSVGLQEAKRVPFVAKAQGPAVVLHDQLGQVDAQKQARDRQLQSRVCQMLRGNPKRPKVCNKP